MQRQRRDFVVASPSNTLCFLRLLAKAFGVAFCKNACCGGTRKSTKVSEGTEGLAFEAQIEPLFSLLARESVGSCLL